LPRFRGATIEHRAFGLMRQVADRGAVHEFVLSCEGWSGGGSPGSFSSCGTHHIDTSDECRISFRFAHQAVSDSCRRETGAW
jgi:hypothetical protein